MKTFCIALFMLAYVVFWTMFILSLAPAPRGEVGSREHVLRLAALELPTPAPVSTFEPYQTEYDEVFVNKVQNLTTCQDAPVTGSPRPKAIPLDTLPTGSTIKSHDWAHGYVMIEPAIWIPVSALCPRK